MNEIVYTLSRIFKAPDDVQGLDGMPADAMHHSWRFRGLNGQTARWARADGHASNGPRRLGLFVSEPIPQCAARAKQCLTTLLEIYTDS